MCDCLTPVHTGHAPPTRLLVEGPSAEELERTFVYVVGGRERGHTLGFVERFSPARQVWEQCPHMIEQRGSHAAAAVDGHLYAFSGGGIVSNVGTCECMEPATHEWHYVAGMATKRHALAAVAGHDAIYAVGGWEDGSRCTAAVEAFSPRENAWTLRPPMLQARRLHGLAMLDGFLYAFGGASDDTVDIRHAERFCLDSQKWEQIRDLPAASCACAAAVDGFVYVLLWGKSVLRFDPRAGEGGEYTKVASLPLPEWYGFAVAVVGPDILAFGGATKGRWSNQAFRFSTRALRWSPLPSMTRVRRRCAAAACMLPPDTPPPAPPAAVPEMVRSPDAQA